MHINTVNTFNFRGEIPDGQDLLVKDDIVKLKRCIFAAQVIVM